MPKTLNNDLPYWRLVADGGGNPNHDERGRFTSGDSASETKGVSERVNSSNTPEERLASAVKAVGGNLSLYGNALSVLDNKWDPGSGEDYHGRLAEHLIDLSKVPAPMISKYVDAGGKVIVGNGDVTQLDSSLARLAGVQPRGWPPGKTYSDVAGVFNPPSGTLVLGNILGAKDTPVSHFALHELGHGIDQLTVKVALLSGMDDFKALHVDFVNASRGLMNQYYTQPMNPAAGLSETFAEGMRGWLRGLSIGGTQSERAVIMRTAFSESGTFVPAAMGVKFIKYYEGKFGKKGMGVS